MSEVMNSDKSKYPPPFIYPAVSVVIPLYNAEKYLGDCLESILNQTFQNFEVIVVDDCSTDSSCAIVESYIPKFDGRLILAHMEKNSGSGALPRNKGLNFSRGEYIFFADADDLITLTSLEELYTLAKDFNADVVYCEKFYKSDSKLKNIKINSWQNSGFVDKPTLETENLSERVQGLLNWRYSLTPWDKFIRRNLMIEHDIYFPHCTISEDYIWNYGLILYARKILRVPNAVYIHRITEESIMMRKRTPEQIINFWINPVVFGLKTLDNFMSKLDFFKQNPQWRFAILGNFICTQVLNAAIRIDKSFPTVVFYDTIQRDFGEKFGEYSVLVSVLLAQLKDFVSSNRN